MNKNETDSNSKSDEIKEDDIDLGTLFTLIGKGISSVFNFIAQVFQTFWHWVLILILFLRSNFRKMALAALIGGLLGGIYQYAIKEKQFESSMTVEPNFGSAVQLYKNINYYLSLVKQDDSERLAASLNIGPEEAESISWIEVEPYSNENQLLISYKNFIQSLDSNTVKLIDYDTFSEELPIESFQYHVITVVGKDKFVFDKLGAPIINSIIANNYYDKVKTTAYSNLITKKSALENSMLELDSLRTIYKKVLLAESQKENAGTNIFMSENGSRTKEIDLFDKYMVMNDQLIEVNEKLITENEVINVVSSFNSIGMRVNKRYKNYAVLGFLGGFIFLFVYLILKELNKSLIQLEKSKM